ncbi:MAG TPA: cob(I)yrinic acid a,c-diamide adenosyltransferase [Rhodocyclaceae bacterium]
MGHRLSKIYTRTGDAGTTGLGDGTRIDKDAPRVAAMGDIDELNSLIGLLLCESLPLDVTRLLLTIQHDLFDLGGELCIPGSALLGTGQPAYLEQAIDRYNSQLQPLKEFILPGGERSAAVCHLARAVSRRAERSVITLHRDSPVSDTARQYVNRLSDLLFVLARWLNLSAGQGDVLWDRSRTGG